MLLCRAGANGGQIRRRVLGRAPSPPDLPILVGKPERLAPSTPAGPCRRRHRSSGLEFAKGFAIWDLAPGQYILMAAGGAVVDLSGRPLTLDYSLDSLQDIASAMSGRQTFVAAGSLAAARQIAATLR